MSAGHTSHCPHGGRVFATATPSAARTVRVDGHPVATAAHTFAVSGCRHAVDGVPRPCVTVRWSPARDGCWSTAYRCCWSTPRRSASRRPRCRRGGWWSAPRRGVSCR
ncbi:hypothetical protein NKH77_40090 [Streptomyces sp. M19]